MVDSFVGDYRSALKMAARTRRVVMIDEDQRDPSHRAFTTELLPILRKQGFRTLAAEAFAPGANADKYPRRRLHIRVAGSGSTLTRYRPSVSRMIPSGFRKMQKMPKRDFLNFCTGGIIR